MHYTTEEKTLIALNILEQLGGNSFFDRTGIDDILTTATDEGPGILIDLPENYSDKGINEVRIIRNGADSYRMEFFKKTEPTKRTKKPKPPTRQLITEANYVDPHDLRFTFDRFVHNWDQK